MDNRRTVLEVEGVSKEFFSRDSSITVLDNISFKVKEGEYISLLGPSGCGKTTMLSIIAGFQKMDRGRILVEGKEVKGPGSDRAYVFQNYALFPWGTVKDNIYFPMREAGMKKEDMDRRFSHLLDISELKGHENKYPHQISGGMKQRTALARAIAVTPEVLLMDEPLGALDIQMRQSLQGEIEKIFLEENPTVIMVTHDVDESVYLSDRVIIMSTGGGHIAADISIDLERIRDRNSPEYKRYVSEISEILTTIKLRAGNTEDENEVVMDNRPLWKRFLSRKK